MGAVSWGFHASQNPALLVEKRGPTHGFDELYTDLGAGFANKFAGHPGAIAAVETDVSGKKIHCSQAAVVKKAAAPLRQVHNWKLQVSLRKSVDLLHDQGRPQEGGVDDSKRCPSIGPLGIGAHARGFLRTNESAPNQIEPQDNDQDSANPEHGKEIVGALTLQFREIQILDGYCQYQEKKEESGNNKLLSHGLFSM